MKEEFKFFIAFILSVFGIFGILCFIFFGIFHFKDDIVKKYNIDDYKYKIVGLSDLKSFEGDMIYNPDMNLPMTIRNKDEKDFFVSGISLYDDLNPFSELNIGDEVYCVKNDGTCYTFFDRQQIEEYLNHLISNEYYSALFIIFLFSLPSTCFIFFIYSFFR